MNNIKHLRTPVAAKPSNGRPHNSFTTSTPRSPQAQYEKTSTLLPDPPSGADCSSPHRIGSHQPRPRYYDVCPTSAPAFILTALTSTGRRCDRMVTCHDLYTALDGTIFTAIPHGVVDESLESDTLHVEALGTDHTRRVTLRRPHKAPLYYTMRFYAQLWVVDEDGVYIYRRKSL